MRGNLLVHCHAYFNVNSISVHCVLVYGCTDDNKALLNHGVQVTNVHLDLGSKCFLWPDTDLVGHQRLCLSSDIQYTKSSNISN